MKLFVHTLVRNINMPAHISNNSFTFYLKPPKNLENNEPSSRKSEKRWGSPGRKAKINTGFLCVCVSDKQFKEHTGDRLTLQHGSIRMIWSPRNPRTSRASHRGLLVALAVSYRTPLLYTLTHANEMLIKTETKLLKESL